MQLSPDAIVFFRWGPIVINATLVFTWVIMVVLAGGSWLVTRNLTPGPQVSRWQTLLETIVSLIRNQIREIVGKGEDRFLPFIGTLFLFISVSNLMGVIPQFQTPAGSLSTTAALALCVFFAVPIFGIAEQGLRNYLRHYVEPSVIMLPFEIIGEISRTFALAVRLFGNMMSGGLLTAVVLSIIPLFIPVILSAFELLIGQIQAYIFAILALVYIGSAIRSQEEENEEKN